MLIARVAHRFAKSLLELSIETGDLENVYKDALMINKACHEIRDFRVLLQSPVIKTDKKINVFKQLFAGDLCDLSVRFYVLIIKKNREDLIQDITTAFIQQYKEHKKIHTIHVETATPLTEDNRERVLDFLKTRTEDDIELIEHVDEDLIGGIVLRLRDIQIDASVKNNLSRLDREFSKDMYSVKY